MSEKVLKKSYYAIIPATVRYDKELTANAKLLYGELTALSEKEGYCWASNNYFAELYEVTPQAISKWINQLAKKGYITLDYERSGKEIKQRNIYIATYQQIIKEVSTKDDEGINKRLRGYQQKIKENTTVNTTVNTTNNNKESKIFDDEAYTLASLLSELHIQNIDSGCKKLSEKQKQTWAGDIEKLHRIDGRSYQDIEKAIRKIKTNGQFWGTVVMSGSKLREKFPTIWAQINQRNGYSKPLPVQTRTAFLDMED